MGKERRLKITLVGDFNFITDEEDRLYPLEAKEGLTEEEAEELGVCGGEGGAASGDRTGGGGALCRARGAAACPCRGYRGRERWRGKQHVRRNYHFKKPHTRFKKHLY